MCDGSSHASHRCPARCRCVGGLGRGESEITLVIVRWRLVSVLSIFSVQSFSLPRQSRPTYVVEINVADCDADGSSALPHFARRCKEVDSLH